MKRLSKLKNQVVERPSLPDKPQPQTNETSKAMNALKTACSFMADVEQAVEMVRAQAGLVFDQGRPEDLGLEFEEFQLGKDLERSEDALNALQKDKTNIKAYINGPSHPDKGTSNKIPFKDWRRQDLTLLAFLSACTLLAMVISTVNVYVNIMASQETVFLDAPILAVMIALLAPCGSAGLKITGNLCTSDTQRTWFKRCLFTASGLAFFGWIVAFSMTFEGVGAGLDWDTVLEGGGKGGAFFVLVQTLCEVLTAASLFVGAQDVMDKYDPEKLSPNPSYALIEDRYQTQLKTHTELTQRYHDVKASRAVYLAARQAFINEQVAAFAVLQARHHDLHTS